MVADSSTRKLMKPKPLTVVAVLKTQINLLQFRTAFLGKAGIFPSGEAIVDIVKTTLGTLQDIKDLAAWTK